ncbi:MAG TPA: hypothetical protein VFQ04_03445, partial [Actinomycetes bacterium]|nr:hypothetical protein [Actinomycetes bacterium]
DTAVRRRPGAGCRLRRHGDRLEVLLGDRTLHMPARLAPAMGAILASDRLVVGDLAGLLDPPSRLVLIRRLVREGSWRRSPGRRPTPTSDPAVTRSRSSASGTPLAFSSAGG